MVENAALRAENQYQKQKRTQKKKYIRTGTSMTIQDGQDGIQRPMVEEQPEDDDENIDSVLLNGQPRSVRKKAPSKCSRCGSFEHNARTCSL